MERWLAESVALLQSPTRRTARPTLLNWIVVLKGFAQTLMGISRSARLVANLLLDLWVAFNKPMDALCIRDVEMISHLLALDQYAYYMPLRK